MSPAKISIGSFRVNWSLVAMCLWGGGWGGLRGGGQNFLQGQRGGPEFLKSEVNYGTKNLLDIGPVNGKNLQDLAKKYWTGPTVKCIS